MGKFRIGISVSFIVLVVSVFSDLVVLSSAQNLDDAAVMNSLKKAITAPSDSVLQWSDPDFCKWKHITCAENRVTEILIRDLNLQGSLPKDLVQLTWLKRFEVATNGFSGSFPYMPKSLEHLLIFQNKFTSIPSDFFKGMTNLVEVRIGENPFSQWNIPDSLKDCTGLQVFSADDANVSGEIPDFFENFKSLTELSLSYNSLVGGLPPSLAGSSIEKLWLNNQQGISKLSGNVSVLQNMTSLMELWLQSNSFTGPIPDLSNLIQLQSVSFRDNQMTGVIPASFINLPTLKEVNLTNNYFQGSPPKFKDGVKVDNDIDRGTNSFCTKVVGQKCSWLVNTLLSVVEPLGYPLKLAQSWQGDDPCGNEKQWTGIVCTGGGNISVINFHNMGLSGYISPTIAKLTTLTTVRFDNNNLTGTIPTELTNLPDLQQLDVSNNHLYGKIPPFRVGVLKADGNPDLGSDKPSPPPGSNDNGGTEKKKNNGSSTGVIVGVVVGVVVLLGVGVVLFFIKCGRKHKHGGRVQTPNAIVVHPHHSGDGSALKISVADNGFGRTSGFSPTSSVQHVEAGTLVISIQVLREVTDNFSEGNILGKGGFGTVYKGELHDGTKIAVKRMESGSLGEKGLHEFQSEIAVLTKVRHRHLVSLLGYCLDGNEKLLVYEFMPLGTLSQHLFDWKEEGLKPLDWKRRLIIGLDVARGVEYLHGLAQQIFIHRDLKPSNILLGDDMRAKVSDFGLVRLAPAGQASFETRVAGTFGYLAPEYAVTGRVTTKVDVYSFGVILMEMITGRRAIDSTQSEENIHLVTWFRRALLNNDSFRKVIDPTMDVDEEALSSLTTVAELAGHCCAREPHQRPDMGHVVNVLAPLVEIWKPSEPNDDNMFGIDFDMSLPQALRKWQAGEGTSTFDTSPTSSSSLLTSGENTQSSIPTRPSAFAKTFTSSDGR